MRLKNIRVRDNVIFAGAPSPGSMIVANERRVGVMEWDAGFVSVELTKNDGQKGVFRIPFANIVVAEEDDTDVVLDAALDVAVGPPVQEAPKKSGPKWKQRKPTE